MKPGQSKQWLLAAAIVFLTLLAYQPVWRAGFVWDDDVYVTQNPFLTAPDGLKRIWVAPQTYPAYFPMVNTTLRFEYKLWGLIPAGYHFVNILLHCINALVVWRVLRRLAVPGSWLAAAIWAIHPVNVESVAWITELKNTQSTLFGLLTLLAWMKFTDSQTVRPWRFYALALLLYGPALFSKTTASTLPAAMLLVLWLRKEPIGWRRCVQIVPFLCYGVGTGLLSVWCEAHSGNYAEALRNSYSGVGRLLIATHALWFYAAKLAWPTQLTFIYPRWEINPRDPLQYVWLIACVAVALLLWWRRKAIGRGPVAAVVFFVAALSPLLGFIPVYTFCYSFVANHYQYVASIGLIALFAGAVSSHADAWQLGRNLRCILSASLLLVLGGLTWQQAHAYRDSETLWRDTLAKNPGCWMAHNNLSVVLLREGRLDEALHHAEQAVQLKPDDPDVCNTLAGALILAGRFQDAIGYCQRAVRAAPRNSDAYNNLGAALDGLGKVQEAIKQFEQAVRFNPSDPKAHINLGRALEKTGRVREAILEYQQVRRIEPGNPAIQNNLAWLLATLTLADGGAPTRAVILAERACSLTTNSVFAYLDTLAAAYASAGRFDDAVTTAQKAIELARAASQPQAANEIAARLELYRHGRAYYESRSPLSFP